MKASREEVETYDRFAMDLAIGAEVVDRKSGEVIIDSARKELLKRWLAGKSGFFLDYGCGEGSFSRFIAREFRTEVVGVDVSSRMVAYASTKVKAQALNYLVADCHALPFKNGSFEAIVAIGIFHHLNLQKAVFECSRVLRRTGVLITFEPNSLGLLSSIGRRFFKTKIHTPNEKTYTYWAFAEEIRRNGFVVADLRFLSFLGFILPFVWASNFGHLFTFMKRRAKLLRAVDQLFEKMPIAKQLCWQFCCKCIFD
jgi:ubiquinone/menaquinone biosynthesis C-methylase UbiE